MESFCGKLNFLGKTFTHLHTISNPKLRKNCLMTDFPFSAHEKTLQRQFKPSTLDVILKHFTVTNLFPGGGGAGV